jgi:hypothetical protein
MLLALRCFDCQQITSQDCKKTAARFTNNAGRRRKAFGFHRRAIPQGKRKREKTRLLKEGAKDSALIAELSPKVNEKDHPLHFPTVSRTDRVKPGTEYLLERYQF